MRLEMRHWLVGEQPNGQPWPSTGGIVDLDDATLAADLVARGAAVAAPAEGDGDVVDEEPTDLTAGSVGDVLARVGSDQVLAEAVLEQEQAKGKPRKGVVDALVELLDETGSCEE